jgi:succinate dehydrogenase/fumarate reductase flavoprotein subunit
VSLPRYPDDEPQLPGGRSGGRSFIAAPYEPTGLDGWLRRFTAFPAEFGGIGFNPATGSKLGGRGGVTLVAGLLEGLLRLGVEPRLDSRAVRLVTEGGAVVGVSVDGADGPRMVRARRGVVLATGGFEWDEDLMHTFVRSPVRGASSPPVSHGDGLRMAMSVGAELGNMSEAWWAPFVRRPGRDGQLHNWGFIFERTRPRSIMVNRFGRRFVNEACAFNSIGGPFQHIDPRHGYVNDPAWVVLDARHLQTYGAFGIAPAGAVPEWFHEADDIRSVAEKAGIDPEGLAATVAAWNTNVRELSDPAFGRGASVHGAWSGDEHEDDIARGTLGPIDTPPFYAVPVAIGVTGTKGGPRTDRHGQVRHVLGGEIPGLYAAGNAMAVILGNGYGGPGSPLALALVWGYRVGQALASQPVEA